jgi:glycosyltransferase involved in cell wall biosynthesis
MTDPLLSICTGTINRLESLKGLVQSVRRTLPRGFRYEIVIADNGSTDGTWDWLIQQPDIVPIQLGEPVGGIRAATTAANTARGKFVVLANDDGAFVGDGLIRAYAHLDTHPEVGGIHFENDRRFGNDHIWARRNGEVVKVIYAQWGMFRKWLGDRCGWWGADHDMADAWTYAGDNWLSARIWELGYEVVALDGVRHDDGKAQDAVREHGATRWPGDAEKFFAAFPQNPNKPDEIRPIIPSAPLVDNPDREGLRILYLSSIAPRHRVQYEQKRGWLDALAKFGAVIELDYVNYRERHGGAALGKRMAEMVRHFQPHLMLSQIHGNKYVRREMIAAARAEKSDMVWVNYCHDYWPECYVDPGSARLLENVDLELTTNASMIPKLEKIGVHGVRMGQAAEVVNEDDLPAMPTHDVLFLGNNYVLDDRLRGDGVFWPRGSNYRQRLYDTLRSLESLGINVGIYGRDWPRAEGENLYDFRAGHALYQNCKIAVADMQFPDAYAYTSNRIYQALYAGAFLLHQESPGFDEASGYQDGKHYVSWKDFDDLREKLIYWLDPKRDKQRAKIAKAGRWYTRRWQSWDRRAETLLLDIIPEMARTA